MSIFQRRMRKPSIVISKLEMALVGYVAKYGITEEAREALAVSEEYEEMTSLKDDDVWMLIVRK